MFLDLDITGYGFDELKTRLDRYVGQLSDYRGAWDDVQQVFYRIEERAFTTQGGSQGGRWRDLKPKYRAWKARRYPGRTILEREGFLRLSLTGKALNRVTKTAHSYSEYSEVPYAKFHAARGPHYRPPVRLTQRDAADIAAAVRRYVGRVTRETFKGAAA